MSVFFFTALNRPRLRRRLRRRPGGQKVSCRLKNAKGGLPRFSWESVRRASCAARRWYGSRWQNQRKERRGTHGPSESMTSTVLRAVIFVCAAGDVRTMYPAGTE